MNGTKWVGAFLAVTTVLCAAVYYWDKSTADSPTKWEPPAVTRSSVSVSAPASAQAGTAPSVPSASGSNKIERDDARHLVIYSHPGITAPGQEAVAQVKLGGTTYELHPNQIGGFDRLNIEPKAKIPIRVTYANGNPGDPISIEVEDGGQLDNKKIAKVQSLDAAKQLAFTFSASEQSGIFRVVLRNGSDVKEISFWAGQQPVYTAVQ